MAFLTYPPAGIDVGGSCGQSEWNIFWGDPTGVTYSTAFFYSTLAGACSNNVKQSFGSLPSAVGTPEDRHTILTIARIPLIASIGSQVFRFEYSFQLKDGTLSDKPVMVQSAVQRHFPPASSRWRECSTSPADG